VLFIAALNLIDSWNFIKLKKIKKKIQTFYLDINSIIKLD